MLSSTMANTSSESLGSRECVPVNCPKAGRIIWLLDLKKQGSFIRSFPKPLSLMEGCTCPQNVKQPSRSSGWWVNKKESIINSGNMETFSFSNFSGAIMSWLPATNKISAGVLATQFSNNSHSLFNEEWNRSPKKQIWKGWKSDTILSRSRKFLWMAFLGTAAPNFLKWDTFPKCTSLISRSDFSSQKRPPKGWSWNSWFSILIFWIICNGCCKFSPIVISSAVEKSIWRWISQTIVCFILKITTHGDSKHISVPLLDEIPCRGTEWQIYGCWWVISSI